MAINLAAEYGGFLRFMCRANGHLSKWFGPHCYEDPTKIVFFAAREWDGMADLERKPFIRFCQSEESPNVNPYIRYLLHSRYSNKAHFAPNSGKQLGQNWKSMTSEEKTRFSLLDFAESGIEHVIKKRDELHQLYDPKKLCILEFMLKTKPKRPSSSRSWYFRQESKSIGSSEARRKWLELSDEERSIYANCAALDRKRYNLEKNAWITKILTLDLDKDQFTLNDFMIPEVKSRIDSLGSFVEMSKDLPGLIGLKRPRSPFSLFIEAYRIQIGDERPEFQFGRHLRECSEAWNKLSEKEREFYREESKKLREKRRDLLSKQSRADITRLTIPQDLLNTNKLSFGSCRPSHLYPRVQSPMSIWSRETNIKLSKRDRKERWDSLTNVEKEPYIKMHQDLKDKCEKEKLKIDQKHTCIKAMLKEASQLEELKQRLRLIGTSGKVVKNLYSSGTSDECSSNRTREKQP